MLLVSTPMVAGIGFDELVALGVVRSAAFHVTGHSEAKGAFSNPFQDGTGYSTPDSQDAFSRININVENELKRQAMLM